MNQCPGCGAKTGNAVCEYCGTTISAPVKPVSIPVQPKAVPIQRPEIHTAEPWSNARLTAFLLCLVLGFFGAHCFYTGKIGMGILYLLTGGLFGIGWLVDLIRIAAGSYSDKNGCVLK